LTATSNSAKDKRTAKTAGSGSIGPRAAGPVGSGRPCSVAWGPWLLRNEPCRGSRSRAEDGAVGGLGESEGESRPRTELRSLAERQAQLTERRCGSRGRRVWGESQLGHEPPRGGLCLGDLRPPHRAVASRTTFEGTEVSETGSCPRGLALGGSWLQAKARRADGRQALTFAMKSVGGRSRHFIGAFQVFASSLRRMQRGHAPVQAA
jgi:hypothetical protein